MAIEGSRVEKACKTRGPIVMLAVYGLMIGLKECQMEVEDCCWTQNMHQTLVPMKWFPTLIPFIWIM
jgi:hypothetical protein